jgi:curved DNA-binding protein CbpA
VLEFHPDKPNGDEEMFDLITHAYNILINPTLRKEYDEIYSLSKQAESSHFDLKSKSQNFYSSQENDVTKKKKTKDEQEIDFKKAYEEMDRKRGYSRDKGVENKLLEKDTSSLLKDLQMIREQDDIENLHDELFDKGSFDLGKFNAVFDEMHKIHNEIIPHKGNPDAWNSVETSFGSNFSTIDNYEDPFAEDENIKSNIYSSVKLENSKNKKLSRDDIKKLISTDYTQNHNYKNKDYSKLIEEKLKERELQTLKLDDREIGEFDTDNSCGGYGIFDQIGIKNLNKISWEDDDDDIKTRYKRLLEKRKNETN